MTETWLPDIGLETQKWRYLIENFFDKPKEFKRLTMRSDKTDEHIAAMIYVASATINARCLCLRIPFSHNILFSLRN
jgi:hypothetical protein